LLIDPASIALVCIAAVFAAMVGAIGGFGTGIVLTAALTPLIGFKAVVPVMAVAGILINAGRYWFYRGSADLSVSWRVLAASIPMMVLGVWVYSLLDASVLGLVLGGFVIASVPLRRLLKSRAVAVGPRGLTAGAGVFGFASGIATGTGVILVSLLHGAGFAAKTVVATDALISIFLDVAKAIAFGRFDLLDTDAALLGVVIGIVTFPGSWLGAYLVNRLGTQLHTLALEGLIVVGGLSMLIQALVGKA
jgi:uncharacterized membrane protein YfcA